jgi:hypothetical protein
MSAHYQSSRLKIRTHNPEREAGQWVQLVIPLVILNKLRGPVRSCKIAWGQTGSYAAAVTPSSYSVL